MTKFPKVRTHHNSKSDTNDYSKVPKSLSTFTSSSTHKNISSIHRKKGYTEKNVHNVKKLEDQV